MASANLVLANIVDKIGRDIVDKIGIGGPGLKSWGLPT